MKYEIGGIICLTAAVAIIVCIYLESGNPLTFLCSWAYFLLMAILLRRVKIA